MCWSQMSSANFLRLMQKDHFTEMMNGDCQAQGGKLDQSFRAFA